ncbi:MAG: 30S ribosomal protein S9 [Candidatus Krumholzibacteriota bacterium]|nr:30S ribosomal protein S9 [Candidatus Krumholzibacteriota bacterium]
MSKEVFHSVGRRKSSVARIYLTEGKGDILVNGVSLPEYMKRESLTLLVRQPLNITNAETKYDIKATVKGGGTAGQAGAIRLGISRAIILHDETMRGVLKSGGFLTRDAREKERKKYGQPGARKKFQFSKR